MHTTSLKVIDHFVSGKSFEVGPSGIPGVLQTLPVPANLEAYYDSDRYLSHTDGKNGLFEKLYQLAKRWNLQRKLQMIDSLLGKPGRLLDVGAGTGDFLLQAQSAGWEIYGTEPNEKARALAHTKGADLREQVADLGSKKFDCITLWHVLEHVPEPGRLLAKLFEHLNPEGRLILALPNHQSFDARHYGSLWAGYDVPRHLWHFSREGIEAYSKPIGFKIIDTRALPLDAYYVSWLSEKYRNSLWAPLTAFLIGSWSNLQALRTGEYSSIIYILKKTTQKAS